MECETTGDMGEQLAGKSESRVMNELEVVVAGVAVGDHVGIPCACYKVSLFVFVFH